MRQRPDVPAANGMVATSHPLATARGLEVLMKGGNAVDAALTAAAVLGVVQPMMSGIGGDSFVVLQSARDKRVYALNGSGPAPRALSIEALQAMGHTELPARGMLSFTIPGAVDVMEVLLERWGSGLLTRRDILAPAIHYAENGAPVAPVAQRRWVEHAKLLAGFPSSRAIFIKEGAAYAAGALHRQTDLAQSLRLLAEGGPEVFYRGALAESIVNYARAHGGVVTLEDFANYRCELLEPISIRYRGNTIYANPPPAQSQVLLEALSIVEGYPLAQWGFGSAESVHALIEAKKLACADRNTYFGDPAFVTNPVATVLSKAYAEKRRAGFDPQRALETVPAGTLGRDGDTTYLCAADRDGNMISFITSLSNPFGCAEVIEGTGILLNNRGGRGFRLEPGHPNSLTPGRRPMHTLHAYYVETADGRKMVGGTPGGDGQPQWNLQILTNVLDFGMGVQQALDAPRWESTPGTDPAKLQEKFVLHIEAGFDAAVLDGLRARGHRLVDADLERAGAAEMILRDADGIYFGASDPRADGCALGF